MTTLAQGSIGAVVAPHAGRRFAAIRVVQTFGLWEFGWQLLDEPGPQTESSIERGYRRRGAIDDQWGLSDGLDPDNVGDIADEGRGHRG